MAYFIIEYIFEKEKNNQSFSLFFSTYMIFLVAR